jgi:phosphatidylserine/phosphatidylglycerophosphate/cardiolipin synthase-like enzyme
VAPPLLDRLDAALGDGLERTVAAHHRRRLARRGQLGALEPDGAGRWATTGPPPRAGNRLEVLVDGASALPAMAAAMRGARSHVHLCGWHLEAGFQLSRGADGEPLRELLARLAERVDVRVLVWAGAPLPVFSPTRRQVRAGREALVRGTRIRCELDACTRPLHCHHEKLLVVDDEVAFVGGIDLTTLAGDRYDSSAHPAQEQRRLGWHDAAVRIHGPLVADVAAHIAMRWEAVAGERLPAVRTPAPAGPVTAQLARTVPERAYRALHDGEFSALEAYVRALRSAQRLIYLENQFLWSPEIVALLEAKLRDPPCDAFRLVVLLPARPKDGGDDTRGQLARLDAADAGAGRLLAATLQSRSGERAGPLYVHAKVAVVDDAWLAVGSVNLNEHSLFNDTEVAVVTEDGDLARDTRLRLWAEHLERDPAEVAGDPAAVVDGLWRPIAREQRERRDRGLPPTHHLLALDGVSRRAKRLLGPLQGLVVDG